MFKLTISMIIIACVGCFGREDTYRGRVINKQRIATNCKFDYNYTTSVGTVTCSEERLALTLDDNDSWDGGKNCYVSDRIFQETEMGSIYTCQYGADK